MSIVALLLVLRLGANAEDWPRFRGPNGTGVSDSTGLPAEFGRGKNLRWRVPLPPGHSSPAIVSGRIYVTAIDQQRLWTYCLRQTDGKALWRREAPRARTGTFDKRNNPASPSPVADRDAVYVFFPEFGMLSYTSDGVERWRTPLGPFDNFYGMGSSPILAGDSVVLVCDQTHGSFAIALSARDGKMRWKQMRKEAVSGHSTPVLYQPKDGPLQVVAPGSFRMEAYQAGTGELLWFVRGLASEMKSVPVVAGGTIYINGYNLPENDPGRQIAVPAFAEMLAKDGNRDGALEKDELPEGRARQFFEYLDLNHDNKLSGEEWRFFAQGMAAENSLLAIRAGGRGDMTAGSILWKHHRSIPQLPSTLLYEGILYMVSDGGILTTFDPGTGKVHRQARLRNVPDRIFSSPVAADGKVYFVTEAGVAVVVKAGPTHEILAVNDLDEDTYATPAISGGQIFVRTTQALYDFERR